jgi:hypothetical protein
MSSTRTLSLEDFDQEPRGPRLFDSWRAREPLDNPLGPFEIELQDPPDEELLGEMNRLVAMVSDQYDAILNIVFEHYLVLSEDKFWMKSCEVPRGLREAKLKRYIEGRSIVVRRNPQGWMVGVVFISPQWEPEHGISLEAVNGKLVPKPD